MILRLRDQGPDVYELQKALAGIGYLPETGIDGDFGPQTDGAVRAFQRNRRLVADGIVGPKTRRALNRSGTHRLLSHNDIVKAAEDLDVEVAAVLAVNEVESRGEGFLEDGRPVILFERHIMRRRLETHGEDVKEWARLYPGVVNAISGGYLGGTAEWARIGLAWSIHPEAAIESASWGLFQIMGFHWQRLGYESPQAFMKSMRDNEGRQLDAFVAFIKADPKLHKALDLLDWKTFAEIYNGPAYAKHAYDKRMQSAYDRHSAALEATV